MDEGDRMSRRMFFHGSASRALPDGSDALTKTGMMGGVESMSRRVFLGGSAGVALLVAAPPAFARKAIAATRSSLSARSRSLTRSRFKPVLGSTLRMTGDGDALDVVLAEITDLLPVLRAEDQHRFALQFHAPRGHRPSGGIRTFHHDDIGDVALFVSPVDQGIKTVRYEAVINRSSA